MSRQPLKKLNDNFELKGEIVNGNRAIEEIVSEQPEANRKLTKTNNIIYASVKTIQDKLLSPPKAVTKHKKPHSDELSWKKIQSILKKTLQPKQSSKMVMQNVELYDKYKIE